MIEQQMTRPEISSSVCMIVASFSGEMISLAGFLWLTQAGSYLETRVL
jgi:hypothetical protein